jgi:hypothetical protein
MYFSNSITLPLRLKIAYSRALPARSVISLRIVSGGFFVIAFRVVSELNRCAVTSPPAGSSSHYFDCVGSVTSSTEVLAVFLSAPPAVFIAEHGISLKKVPRLGGDTLNRGQDLVSGKATCFGMINGLPPEGYVVAEAMNLPIIYSLVE